MNNGHYLKTFITVGSHANTALGAFTQSWKFGWISHINIGEKDSIQDALLSTKDSFMMLISDADRACLDKAQSFIDSYPGKDYIEYLVFDPQPSKNTIKPPRHLPTAKIVNNESLNVILECYAHVLCGPSLVCLDFCDMHDWLSSGYLFEQHTLTSLTIENIGQTLTERLNRIKNKYACDGKIITGINAVLIGHEASLKALEKLIIALEPLEDDGRHISLHSNASPNACGLWIILFIATTLPNL